MCKKVILPLKDNILRAWPEDNFLLSIIQNKETAYDWIMNYLIQTVAVIGDNGEGRIKFYPSGEHHKRVNLYDLCPFIRKYTVPMGIILEKYNTFSNFLVYALNNGFYVSNILDQYFIPLLNGKKNYFYHPNYIYGYNLSEKIFSICDNFELGKYKSIEVSFDLINEAFILLDSFPWEIYEASANLYEVVDTKFKFDLNLFIELLNDYLLSRNNLGNLDNYIRPQDRNICFGIGCYDVLYDYVKKIVDKNGEELIDLRSFVFLIDHKTLMRLRVEFLKFRGYLSRNTLAMKIIENLENHCIKTLNLAIKYNFTKDPNIIHKLMETLENIKKMDKEVISMLVDELTRSL